uniref:Peptidase M13 N-terminal domain-containing protein n=1 Tax=Stomoxys calcitrans TaxID=35570 RepID=A0A1I8P2V8_STOCA
MLHKLDLSCLTIVLLLICAKLSAGQAVTQKPLPPPPPTSPHSTQTTKSPQNDTQLLEVLRLEQVKWLRRQKAQEMLRYLNTQQLPCKDFYEYGCGNWLKAQLADQAVQPGESWSVEDAMEAQLIRQIQNILTDAENAAQLNGTMVKSFYCSCLHAEAESSEQKKYIRTFVEYYGGLPYMRDSTWQETNYNWTKVIGQLKHRYNLDILIRFTIPKTRPDRGATTPILEEPSRTVLPPHLCNYLAAEQARENGDEVFNGIQSEIKDNLMAWLDLGDTDATRLAGDIQRFEFELCKYMRKRDLRDLPFGGNETDWRYNAIVYNTMHGVPQPKITNQIVPVSILDSRYGLEFSKFVEVCVGTINAPRTFYFRDEEYFQHLSTIAKKGLTPSFAYYIMYRALSEILIPRNLAASERPNYCARKTLQLFPNALGDLYQAQYRDDRVLKDLQHILDYIKKTFARSIETNAHWLPEFLRSDIKQRSWSIREPEFHAGLEMNKNPKMDNNNQFWTLLDAVMLQSAHQHMDELRSYTTLSRQNLRDFVVTYAINDEKRIQFSWDLLQAPFYNYNYPMAMKFSSVGFVMAREMVKYFDQQGWENSPAPLVNVWNVNTVVKFNHIKECFRTQASNYLYNAPQVFRNGTQLRQFLADSNAVNIAFGAYINWLEEQPINGEELQMETLPDVDFTNTQLFFINFAQTRCAARPTNDKASKSEHFPMARHNLERMSINGPLWNGYEFGRDFNCRVGANMNVHDKCSSF